MKHSLSCILLVELLVLPAVGCATEEYARQTGLACAACHLDPGGGGELTADGKAFSDSKPAQSQSGQLSLSAKGLRFAIGYLHMLTAILWFGTILYVHLVLKPAYAAGGLPRGEVRVGVLSMLVMGLTGLVLTYYRVPSLEVLLHTRFGLLLLVKVGLYLVMLTSATVVVTVIGPRLKRAMHAPPAPPAAGDMTVAELGVCDGKDGRPAYIAYNGLIYDASDSSMWKQGQHMARHNAGMDLTEALKLAPHSEDRLQRLPLVGRLLADRAEKPPLHLRVFYTMAYMNLSIVFLIVLILALWRWGW
jgi:predicted heme/steroid binding protein